MYNLAYYDTQNTFPGNSFELILKHKIFKIIKLTPNHSKTEWFKLISNAHIYQLNAARDEVPIDLQVNSEFLKHAKRLLLVSSSGSGVDPININQCTKSGVLVVNQSGGNAQAVAEHALSMMINLLKRISETDHLLRRGWNGSRKEFIGQNLFGKTIGIVGLGSVGRKLARICFSAFNCKILAFDPYIDTKIFLEYNAKNCSLDELLQNSDIVSIHIPLNKNTKNMFNITSFNKMKKGSVFLTTARGSIHNEDDLYNSLINGHLSGAGLDVWEKEPPDKIHKLLSLTNVIASPHMAGVTIDSRKLMGEFVAQQIYELFTGHAPSRPLNPEVIPIFRKKYNKLKN